MTLTAVYPYRRKDVEFLKICSEAKAAGALPQPDCSCELNSPDGPGSLNGQQDVQTCAECLAEATVSRVGSPCIIRYDLMKQAHMEALASGSVNSSVETAKQQIFSSYVQ